MHGIYNFRFTTPNLPQSICIHFNVQYHDDDDNDVEVNETKMEKSHLFQFESSADPEII